jgi:nitrogen fixation/metabolism regulation signal transduction histidine kinase
VPELLRARILEGTRVVDEWSAPPDVLAVAREGPPNLVELPNSRPEKPRTLELTFGISREIYANFLALQQAMDREQDLDRLMPVVLPRIFRGLGLAVVIVLAFATTIGLLIARRATRKVAALREAARRVGEGDLSVRVSARGKDELDELGRTFDRMVAELSEARPRLEYLQKVSAWQEVARRLAHEIKNPLTPIQLAVQELGSKYRGEDAAYQRLLATAQEILGEEIGTIRRLVDDFSAFAKLPKVEPAPLDLGQLVEDFVRAHPEWQPFVRFSPPQPHVSAQGDRLLIRRVLANLIENAVQASQAAGRAPEVALSVAADAARGLATLTVDDNGPGIAARERERVFDPYVTTKEHGTGLGLAIVRKIVLDHGGDVHASAAPVPLGGARLTVTLPVAAEQGAAAPPPTAPGGPPPP